MIKTKRLFTSVLFALSAVSVCAAVVPVATAAENTSVASVRTFPAQKRVSAQSAFIESTSVNTDDDSNWGGVESLDVKTTESSAQKEAQQRAEESQRAASRSAARTSRSAATSAFDGVALPTSVNGAAVASYAQQFVGAPYAYGGTTPAGWDCSGFTAYVYSKFGLSLTHQSEAQKAQFASKRVSNPQPGDLMWKPGHVGIYLGNGMMVHAASPGQGTVISSVAWANFEYYRII